MLESRILQVFANSGLSKTEFALKIGISNAVLSHISSGRNKASTDLILNILTHFPDISTDWLLLGQGQMLRSSSSSMNETVKENLLNDLAAIHASNDRLSQQLLSLVNRVEKL